MKNMNDKLENLASEVNIGTQKSSNTGDDSQNGAQSDTKKNQGKGDYMETINEVLFEDQDAGNENQKRDQRPNEATNFLQKFVRDFQDRVQNRQERLKKLQEKRKEEEDKTREILNIEKTFKHGIASIKDLISPSGMMVEYDHLRVSGMYAQSFFVFAYPRYLQVGWLSPLVNSDVTMDLSIYVYPVEI